MLIHRGLRDVLGSLAEISYDAVVQDIRASDVGAPHRRERIWIVAYPGHMRRRDEGKRVLRGVQENGEICDTITGPGEARNVAYPDATGERRESRQEEIKENVVADAEVIPEREQADETDALAVGGKTRDEFSNGGNVADTDRQGLEGRDIDREYSGQRTFGEGLQSFPGEWLPEPDVGRLAHGIPHRVDRLRGLGNSIVPQIAEILFLQIKELL